MTLALLVIGDGRVEYLTETLASARANLPAFDHYFMVDDSADTAHARHLDARYPEFTITHHTTKQGLAGAVQTGWQMVLDSDADYVFHLEEDWTFTRPVDIPAMQRILGLEYLAEITLKRGIEPGNAHEVIAGGFMEADPTPYTELHDSELGIWIEHQHLFSLNPSLIPRRTLELGWPSGPLGTGNESGFTDRCLDAGKSFAYIGAITDPPAVTHIGARRSPTWQL